MLQWCKNQLRSYLFAGVEPQLDTEIRRQIIVINLFSAVGLSITLFLGANAAMQLDTPLALGLLLAGSGFFASHLFLKLSNMPLTSRYRLSANVLLGCLMALMLYLVYAGGANNTGPLWIYLVPPVAMFFGGMRKGLRDIAIFVVLISIMMFYPDGALLSTDYSFEFKTRLLLSFLTLTFLAGFYENSRCQSYLRIQELSDQFEQQARQDPLTHLPNRRGMKCHLEYEHNRSLRSKLPMSIMLCDIDHFKSVNDQFGHDAGDAVLIQIADTFRKALRKQDLVARWGGEEFLFLLPETNVNDALIIAEKVRKKVQNSDFHHQNRKITATVSIGLGEVSEATPVEQTINLADQALYHAKSGGRNRSVSAG